MVSNIEIVKVNIEDAGKLSQLSKATFYNTFTGTCTPEDMEHFLNFYYSEDVLKREIENSDYHYYFVKCDNEFAGYLLFAENNDEFRNEYSKALELKRFYLLPYFHGKNIAQKMMDFFLSYARNKKFEIAFLGVWEYNYKAQNFYSKYDFIKTTHTHGFPVGLTPQLDVYMVKKL